MSDLEYFVYDHRKEGNKHPINGRTYSNKNAARRARDRLDLKHGSAIHSVGQRSKEKNESYSFVDKITNEEIKIFLDEQREKPSYDNWDHEKAVSYSKYLEKHFGQPDEFTNEQAVWHHIDGFKKVVCRDEYILHCCPEPHYDFVYSYIDLEVPKNLSDELAQCSESILIDHLKNEVGARCGSLTANAVTLNFCLDVVSKRTEPTKEEYEKRIKSMKKMFSDGKKFELSWWPDEAGDADPKNEFYKESNNHLTDLNKIINEEIEAFLDEKRKKRKGGKRDGKGASSKGYSLRDWFKGGGWVQAGGKYDGKPCAKQPGQKTKPYCRDPDDRAKLSKKERDKRASKKRKKDPNPNRRGKAINVRQKKSKRKKNE